MRQALINYLPSSLRKILLQRINLVRAAENTGWIIANNVLRILVGMVVGVWVARYLGPTQFGLYSYASSVINLFGAAIPLGFTQLSIRDLARSRDERNYILGNAFYTQLATSFVMLLIAVSIALFTHQSDPVGQELILILSLSLLLIPFNTVGFWFQAELKSFTLLIANSTSLFFMAGARIWLLQTEASLQAFTYLIIAERAVNILTLLYLYQRSGESLLHWRLDLPRARYTFWEGMPIFWSGMARSLYSRGTEIMLNALTGPSAVGYYASANKIADLYAIVTSAITASATPIIAKSKIQNRTLYLNQVTNLFRVTGGIGVAITLVIATFSSRLMPLIYGPEFADAGGVLAIMVWASIPASLNLVTGIWIVNEGITPIAFQKTIVMAALIIVLNWWLIPRYGALGAATSMLTGSIIVHILWDFIDPRMRNFAVLKLHAIFPWWVGLKNV